MLVLLIVVAIILGIAGALFLSNATLGVGLIALGCLAGIVSRIIQASEQGQNIEMRLVAMDNTLRALAATREKDATSDQ